VEEVNGTPKHVVLLRNATVDVLWLVRLACVYALPAPKISPFLQESRLDGAFKITRVGKLVDRGANTQAITAHELPPRLRQGEGFG
jgi:hypothetical protein